MDRRTTYIQPRQGNTSIKRALPSTKVDVYYTVECNLKLAPVRRIIDTPKYEHLRSISNAIKNSNSRLKFGIKKLSQPVV